MKLARKLTLFLVLGMCLVLGLDYWLSIRHELRLHAADTAGDQLATGRALSVAVADLWKREGRGGALALVTRANAASSRPNVRWIDLGARPGGRFAPSAATVDEGRLGRGEEIQVTSQEPRGPGRFITWVPVRVDGTIVGALEVSESLAEIRGYVRTTLIRRIAVAALLTGLSALIAMLVGTLFVGRPIRSLVDTTRRIAAGDLSQSPGSFHADEIGDLAREVGTMSTSLRAARDQIAAETRARIEAIEQMRHADRLVTVGRLASGVAHELGTPLNVASERARMIASGDVTGAEAADGARIIADQARRMTSVVRQLLDFARRHVPNKSRQDLHLIARQTAQFLTPVAQQRSVTLRVEGGPAPTHADVDAGQIQQALTNLVVNGIQASGSGGEVVIAVGARTVHPPADHGGGTARYACLVVGDQGPGIAPEHLPRVFEPFFTTKRPGEGTGLGLAVAQGIVQDHGGWIECESTIGCGSRFTLNLPSAEDAGRDGTELASAGDGKRRLEVARPHDAAPAGLRT